MKLFNASMAFLLATVISIVVTTIYSDANSDNPNSRFCRWRIYKRADGMFEVWEVGRFRHKAWVGSVYQDAEAHLSNELRRIHEFRIDRPTGERVK